MLLTIENIAAFTNAHILDSSCDVTKKACGITWDSREVQPGFVYVALPGQRVDGHSFIESACKAGASAILIMQDVSEAVLSCARECGTALLRVESTQDAFTDLARGYRSLLQGHVIGITGSTGKTTTKNLVRDVLSAKFSCVATKANQNNELGVPRTLLNADPDTEMIVVEMGMRGLGQIEHLCEFVKPDWGLITNVGESHIELLGSRENIARAKAELICALPEKTGIAFLNVANDMSDFIWAQVETKSSGITKVLFDGTGNAENLESPAVWAEDVFLDGDGYPSFTLCAKGFDTIQYDSDASSQNCNQSRVERVACTLSLRGIHNISNACSAAAVGCAAGMTLEEIATALKASKPESGRQEILHSEQGFTVINDAYNANPDSMRASLSLLNAMDVSGRRIAVLGDMGELGSYAQAAHESVGVYAAHGNIDFLVCVGELARSIGSAAQSEGFPSDCLCMVNTRAEALEFLQNYIAPGDAVLVKASHFMELDVLAKGLLD